MGIIFSRYRRKKTPLEVLEGLEEEIISLEDTRQITLQRQKKIVGHLIIYSVLIYVVAAVVFYFYFFPASLKDRIFYMIPLLIFPIIVILVKRLVTWYFKREIVRSKDKLIDLRAEKKKILDEVMDKETYKVAKEILEKFAPDQLNKSQTESIGAKGLTVSSDSGSRVSPVKKGSPSPSRQPPSSSLPEPMPPKQMPPQFPQPRAFTAQPLHTHQPRRLIRPVLPQNRSVMDRIVETIVGDGPNNRYALICKNCATHNGMALKEEFEYIAFRCVYCGFPNPARKTKPTAPELPDKLSQHSELESEDDSVSQNNSKPELKENLKDRSSSDSNHKNPFYSDEEETEEEVVGNGITEESSGKKGELEESDIKVA